MGRMLNPKRKKKNITHKIKEMEEKPLDISEVNTTEEIHDTIDTYKKLRKDIIEKSPFIKEWQEHIAKINKEERKTLFQFEDPPGHCSDIWQDEDW